jgi:flagellar biosynthetic protein FliR
MNGLQFVLSPESVIRFMLVVARLGGAIVAAPFFGHAGMPMRVRAALALAVALAFTAHAPMSSTLDIENIWSLAGAVIVEAAAGLMLGLVPQFILGGVLLGGEMAGIHMGIGVAHLVDPLTNVNATPVALLFQFLTMLVFLALNVHHLILRALARSFTVAPVGAFHLGAAGLSDVLGLATGVFEIAVRIAAPIVGALLIIDTAMGLLARSIKELNVFIMGFTVKIGVGLLLLGTALPYVVQFLQHQFAELEPTLVGLLVSFR